MTISIMIIRKTMKMMETMRIVETVMMIKIDDFGDRDYGLDNDDGSIY